MTNRTLGFLVLILGALPVSCSVLGSSSSFSSVSSSEDSFSSSFEEQSEQEYLDFWEPNTELHFSLTAPYASLNGIQEAFYSSLEADDDIYYIADLVVDMTTSTYTKHYVLDDVGIRMKGNTSRTDFMNEDGSFYNLIHYKISFDEFMQGRKFLGMKKLDLKWNKNYDATQIKQAYSYKMFEDMGVLAPKATISPLTLTTTSLPGGGSSTVELGLYEVIEAVDKSFIKRRFSDTEEGGNLYKCTWGFYGEWTGSDLLANGAVTKSGSNYLPVPNGRIGLEIPDSGWVPNYKLKTNETTADYSDIATLIGVLNSTQDFSSSTVLAQIENLIDVDNFLRYEAVSYLLGDPDDTRNNYNNYYLYFTKTSRKAYFIPFDFDRCLGLVKDWNPLDEAMTSVGPFSDQAAGQYNAEQRNPLYKFLILSGGSAAYREQYATYLADLFQGTWFTNAHFEHIYDDYYASYQGLEVTSVRDIEDNPLYTAWSLDEPGDGSGEELNLSFASYRSRKYETVFNALEAEYPNLLD